MPLNRRLLTSWLLLWALPVGGSALATPPWLLIDTRRQTLELIQDGTVQQRHEDIAIGRFGATTDKRLGDGMTPLGSYRLLQVRDSDRFHRFLALSYPTPAQAERALAAGDIDAATAAAIREATTAGRLPPQDSALGGHIGIHGLGRGDPAWHQDFNWTQGCVALTDAQIDALTPHLRPGMRVVIR